MLELDDCVLFILVFVNLYLFVVDMYEEVLFDEGIEEIFFVSDLVFVDVGKFDVLLKVLGSVFKL